MARGPKSSISLTVVPPALPGERPPPPADLDYDFVAHELRDLFRRHTIQKVAYYPWHFDFSNHLWLRAGFTERTIGEHFQEFAQTTKMMSPAMANLERLLLDGCLVHDSPVLSICVANTTISTDAVGNRAPDKRKSTHRIDGTVAWIMDLAMAPSTDESVRCGEPYGVMFRC